MNLICHCGCIKISVNNIPETLTSCNCSICNRYGSLWGYYAPADVSIDCNESALGEYKWSDENIEFKHCKSCCCVTHYTTTSKINPPKVGVNFRMAKKSDIQQIRIRHFDGANTWKFLD